MNTPVVRGGSRRSIVHHSNNFTRERRRHHNRIIQQAILPSYRIPTTYHSRRSSMPIQNNLHPPAFRVMCHSLYFW